MPAGSAIENAEAGIVVGQTDRQTEQVNLYSRSLKKLSLFAITSLTQSRLGGLCMRCYAPWSSFPTNVSPTPNALWMHTIEAHHRGTYFSMISKCSLENHPGHAVCFSSKLMIRILQGIVMVSLFCSQNFRR